MKIPTCSIIIPTYNQADYLREALSSVFDQNYSDFEIIVIDNYSEDHTIQVCNEFTDNRLSVYSYSNGGNIAASRNYGLRYAQGSIIAFLDSDDVWYSNKLQACISRIENGDDLVCHGEYWRYPNGRWKTVFYGPEGRASYSSLLLRGNCISTSAVVVRRKFVDMCGGFSENPQFITAEDYDLWLRIVKEGASIGFIREVLGLYRLHKNSSSNDPIRNLNAVLAVVENHLSRPELAVSSRKVKFRKFIIYYTTSVNLFNNRNFFSSLKYFLIAVICLVQKV